MPIKEKDPRASIVIVGAGIIGLNTALILSKRGYGQSITVIAEYLPGDTSIRYTSPWAGCNFSAISGSDANALRWDQLTYAHLTNLADTQPKESFTHRTESIEYWDDNVPREKIKTMAGYLQDFRVLPEDELPSGVKFGVGFTTVTVHAPQHLKYLYRMLQDKYGVRFVRQKLPSIQAAFSSSDTKVVFNCIGMAAKTLPGVEDPKCYPTRGQVVLTRAPNVTKNILRYGKDYITYIIPRPFSNGNVILGGYMQKGNDDDSTYGYETESILRRTIELHPQLHEEELEILAVNSGLRPSREGGARVEKDEIDVAGEKRVVIHNYGAGGTGFQAGYGMAFDSVRHAEDLLRDIARTEVRSRL